MFRANEINISIREKANGGARKEKGRREKSPTKKEKRERERERRAEEEEITGWRIAAEEKKREKITARPALRGSV